MSHKQKYDDLLGMKAATATHRLKQAKLHSILRKYGEDICFRCNKPILTPEELSLDHVKPWRPYRDDPGDADLFWDVDNTAYSHKKCNTPDRRHSVECPEGQSWCNMCKKFLPEEDFGKGTRPNGRNPKCLVCDRARNAEFKAKRRLSAQ